MLESHGESDIELPAACTRAASSEDTGFRQLKPEVAKVFGEVLLLLVDEFSLEIGMATSGPARAVDIGKGVLSRSAMHRYVSSVGQCCRGVKTGRAGPKLSIHALLALPADACHMPIQALDYWSQRLSHARRHYLFSQANLLTVLHQIVLLFRCNSWEVCQCELYSLRRTCTCVPWPWSCISTKIL